MAVSSIEGQAVLNIPEESETNEGLATLENLQESNSSYIVQTVSLANFIKSSISLLKIDVEGHEYEVLKGAESFLQQQLIKHITFEEHNIYKSRAVPYLQKFGYSIFSIGWDLEKVILKPIGTHNVYLLNDAPNFIATIEPALVTQKIAKPGWSILSCR